MNINNTPIATETEMPEAEQGALPDSPEVIVFPPSLYLGTLFLGLDLHLLWPAHLVANPWLRIAGIALAIASIFVGRWAFMTMKSAGTNITPSKPALAIVTDGPFRFTRNPLYLTNALVYLALTMIFNTVWLLLLFGPMLFVIHWGIIRREERYLEAKFGDVYLAYKARVRRWL